MLRMIASTTRSGEVIFARSRCAATAASWDARGLGGDVTASIFIIRASRVEPASSARAGPKGQIPGTLLSTPRRRLDQDNTFVLQIRQKCNYDRRREGRPGRMS